MTELDRKAIVRGRPYRIDFEDGTPSLYVRTLAEIGRTVREVYPDVRFNAVDTRKPDR